MFDNLIEDIVKRLSNAVPPELQQFKKDLEKNFKSILNSCFSKMSLVTREEFEAQKNVLAKTRAKLNEMEKELAQLTLKKPILTLADKKHDHES